MSNVTVYDSFLSIGRITSAQASPHYLFARSESLLFLDSIPLGLSWYLAPGIEPLLVNSKFFLFFWITNPYILWICRISCEHNPGLSESITSASGLLTMTTPFPFISHLLFCQWSTAEAILVVMILQSKIKATANNIKEYLVNIMLVLWTISIIPHVSECTVHIYLITMYVCGLFLGRSHIHHAAALNTR